MIPRSFYSFETSESNVGAQSESSSFFQQYQKEKEGGGGSNPLTHKKSKSKPSKHSSKELSGKNVIGFFF